MVLATSLFRPCMDAVASGHITRQDMGWETSAMEIGPGPDVGNSIYQLIMAYPIALSDVADL